MTEVERLLSMMPEDPPVAATLSPSTAGKRTCGCPDPDEVADRQWLQEHREYVDDLATRRAAQRGIL